MISKESSSLVDSSHHQTLTLWMTCCKDIHCWMWLFLLLVKNISLAIPLAKNDLFVHIHAVNWVPKIGIGSLLSSLHSTTHYGECNQLVCSSWENLVWLCYSPPHHNAVNVVTNIWQAVTQSVFGAKCYRLHRWKGLLLLFVIGTSDVCTLSPTFLVKYNFLYQRTAYNLPSEDWKPRWGLESQRAGES